MATPIKNLSIYVINLDRSKRRLQEIQKRFAAQNISFTRFAAIAGDELSLDDIKAVHKNQKWIVPLSPNEIACYASHINVLKYFLEHSHNEYALICEDDIALDAKLREKLTMLINNWPKKHHMIKPYVQAFPSGRLIKSLTNSKVNFTIHLYDPFKIASTALCHIVNRQGAQKIIDNMKITRPIDVDFQCSWEHGIKILQTNNIRNMISPQGGISSIQRPQQKSFFSHMAHLYYKIWHYTKNISHHIKHWGLILTFKYALSYQKDKIIYKIKRRYRMFLANMHLKKI